MLTPVCIIGIMGTMVTLKYEVDESYWLINYNDNLTTDQKQNKINELDKKGRQLKMEAYTIAFFAFATFVTSTWLFIKRKKILDGQKGST